MTKLSHNKHIARTKREWAVLDEVLVAQEKAHALGSYRTPEGRAADLVAFRLTERAELIARNERGVEVPCGHCSGEGGHDVDRWSHSYGHYTTGRVCSECDGTGKGRPLLGEEDPDSFTQEEVKNGDNEYSLHLFCSGLSPDEDEEHGCSYCARLAAADAAA